MGPHELRGLFTLDCFVFDFVGSLQRADFVVVIHLQTQSHNAGIFVFAKRLIAEMNVFLIGKPLLLHVLLTIPLLDLLFGSSRFVSCIYVLLLRGCYMRRTLGLVLLSVALVCVSLGVRLHKFLGLYNARLN